ncbi:MAG TPA: hypothetical protein VFN05_15815 [Actinomycetes bacterium]|nr:hypothetical protein [Actinomycetes bacterium]
MVDWRASYRVTEQRPLGTGGQARVLTAERRSDGQRVALKLPLPGVVHEDARRRLRREIEAQATLDHAHIMPILDHDPGAAGW